MRRLRFVYHQPRRCPSARATGAMMIASAATANPIASKRATWRRCSSPSSRAPCSKSSSCWRWYDAGLACARSHFESVIGCTPSITASCCCVNPSVSRISRMRCAEMSYLSRRGPPATYPLRHWDASSVPTRPTLVFPVAAAATATRGDHYLRPAPIANRRASPTPSAAAVRCRPLDAATTPSAIAACTRWVALSCDTPNPRATGSDAVREIVMPRQAPRARARSLFRRMSVDELAERRGIAINAPSLGVSLRLAKGLRKGSVACLRCLYTMPRRRSAECGQLEPQQHSAAAPVTHPRHTG